RSSRPVCSEPTLHRLAWSTAWPAAREACASCWSSFSKWVASHAIRDDFAQPGGRLGRAPFVYTETGDRVVAAICRKQKPSIRGEDDATSAFEGVRCAFLAADRLESPGADAARGHASYLGKCPARRPAIVHNGV